MLIMYSFVPELSEVLLGDHFEGTAMTMATQIASEEGKPLRCSMLQMSQSFKSCIA